MEIVLHIGPHKTGTTSIQWTLLQRFGAETPSAPIWYPKPEQSGPGHAQLKNDPTRLRALVNKAEKAGVQTLLLSSEDFCIGYSTGFAEQREALRGHDLHLVSTVSPIMSRAPSYWQEMMKHGDTTPLERIADLVLTHPGFQPDLIEVAADALSAKKVSVVMTSHHHPPELLINNFLDALGLDNPVITAPRSNMSLGLIESEILHGLNVAWSNHSTEPNNYNALRDVLVQAFKSDEWREHCPTIPISVPTDVEPVMLDRERATLMRIEQLRDSSQLRVFGYLDC